MQAVKEELADVLVYCRNMLDKLELDEDEIVNAKMEQNEKKYPVEKAKVLKKRLKDEGNQLVTNCNQLKMKSPKDGKRYKTDVANTGQLLRIIQSTSFSTKILLYSFQKGR